MAQVKISIPDDLLEIIESTGRPAEDVILDLIRDRFQKRDQNGARPLPEGTPVENWAIEQERMVHRSERAGMDQALDENLREFSAKVSEYKEKGLAKGKGKESLERIKKMEASIQGMVETQHETERHVERLERTVDETKGIIAASDKLKGDTKWSEPLRVDNKLSNINSWREVYEKDEATLRPRIQDINSCRT
jgi:hypothetical protein